jgi:hypothetical protein
MNNFAQYHAENPQIWEAFKKTAIEAKNKGFKNYSSKGIFEIIRWHTTVSGNDGFKVNNIYTPDYARKLMNEMSEFVGFFRVREIKADRKQYQNIINPQIVD